MSVNVPKFALPTLIAAVAILLAACGSDSDDSGSTELEVAATTSVAADIVRQVAGEDAEVVQLVPDGSSPHSYSPSAQEQQDLVESDLLVYFHPALEEAITIEDAAESFAIADHVGELREYGAAEVAEGAHEGGEERGGEEEHSDELGAGSDDPHVWLDPTAVRASLPALAEQLGAIDPDSASAYEERADAYAEELTALDTELEELTAAIPDDDRKLVTSHDLMGYFADRYGFEFVGAPFGLSPEAEASAGEVAELIETVEAAQVPAVFAQSGDNPQVLETIAGEAGVEVVDDLLVETLGEQAGSYVEMMRLTTQRITDALSS